MFRPSPWRGGSCSTKNFRLSPLNNELRSGDATSFSAAWQAFLADGTAAAQPPDLHAYLGELTGDAGRWLFAELLECRPALPSSAGRDADVGRVHRAFADFSDAIGAVFNAAAESVDGSLGSTTAQPRSSDGHPSTEPVPEMIGRYQVQRTGRCGQLRHGLPRRTIRSWSGRWPSRSRTRTALPAARMCEAYLREARIVARLEHPHIVPVHDAGLLDDGRCYVVSKWIDGGNLASRLQQQPRPAFAESARWVAKLATALQVAERQKITHRDIKPANILIDGNGEPFLADFGLALREEELGHDAYQGMTPSYASPEQASGESHRVDGRSDIFSLGVVFYELLTGERPFTGSSRPEVLKRILTVPARPPRQLNPAIPPELERICLKALEKRASDRYSTAFDLAQDLRCSCRKSRVGNERGNATAADLRLVPAGGFPGLRGPPVRPSAVTLR